MFPKNQCSRTRHFVRLGGLILIGFAQFAAAAKAQEPAQELGNLKTEIEVRNMLQLRGEVGSIFGEVDWGEDAPKLDEEMKLEFEKELKRLAIETLQRKQQNAERAKIANASLAQPRPADLGETANSASIINKTPPFSVNSARSAKSLRTAARQLESAAWELEEAKAYEYADSIRQQADELRRLSRQFVD